MRVSMDPLRGPRPAHRRSTRTAADRRPVLHRASISEMVVPYGDPGPDARLEERLRRRRMGSRTDGQLAGAGLRLPRRHPLPRRRLRHRAGRALCREQCHLHPRGGLRDPLEAPGHARRAHRGAPVPAAGDLAPSPRSATTSTASTGTSTSTAPSSSRSSSPGSCSRPRRSRPVTTPAVTHRSSLPDLAAPVHQHLFCARLDLDVDGTVNEVYEVERRPVPPGPDNPWATPSAASRPPRLRAGGPART